MPVEVKSTYEIQGGQPLVELTLGGVVVHLDANKALDLGESLMRAALAARADAFVFEFARAELGVDDLAAAVMLRTFRAWRLAQDGTETSGRATGTSAHSPSDSTTEGIAEFLASTEWASKP
jgi:hypothetical protein